MEVTPLLGAFVGNDAWFAVLLSIHVAGAIIGLGPTFTFSVLGPMAEKATSPQGGLAIMEAMHKIEWRLVEPILLTTQPLTGALMIWNRGLNNDFFSWSRGWLIAALLMYVTATFLALRVLSPTSTRMIAMAKGGEAGSPEFMRLAGISKKVGPVLTLLGLGIIVLMVWKPGGECGPLIRC